MEDAPAILTDHSLPPALATQSLTVAGHELTVYVESTPLFEAMLRDIAQALSLPDIDAVAICTPSGEHADLVVAALQAGKHVVVEKPLDVLVAAAGRVAVAERDSGKRVTVISQHRFDPSSQVVREALSAGRLGRVTSGSASISWWRSQAYYDSAGWRGTWAMDGGGALMNQAIHQIDILRWLAGPVAEVSGEWQLGARHKIESEDVVNAVLRYASGATGVIQASTALWPGYPERTEFHGTKGTAIITGDKLTTWDVATIQATRRRW